MKKSSSSIIYHANIYRVEVHQTAGYIALLTCPFHGVTKIHFYALLLTSTGQISLDLKKHRHSSCSDDVVCLTHLYLMAPQR